ncbi:MAG: hypothetical protein ABI162_06875 [Luteolibacter sp.]
MMTPHQRILALDAAACACESVVPREILGPLQAWLDKQLDEEYSNLDFQKFLNHQNLAVVALAVSPEVFGGV